MSQITKKLLFSDISQKVENDIKSHFDDSVYISEFCNFENTEEFISYFHPELLFTAITSSNTDYEKKVAELKKISDKAEIPLVIIVNMSQGKPYQFLFQNNIHNIITTPLYKKYFINFLEQYLFTPKSEISTDTFDPSGVDSYSHFNHSIISNLVTQNKMVKNHLKNEEPADEFERVHLDKVNEQRIVENKLWEAYENQYFRLFYQPVIALESGKLAGFEALIRILHPDEGLITPGDFIDTAEKSAIIFPLGLWIIEEACRQINIWKKTFVLDTPLRINVNLSAKQFIHPELTHHIFEITERLEITENDIAFELTESAFMEDMESANIALLELKSKKFALYMDDFGTGYSSLSYLMHFPVNVIKIDQSFVKWMHIDEQSETLVKSLVSLAHNLGLKVVAEGTDDESHIEILKNCGCDYAQGYYFAKPLTAEDASNYISDHFKNK